MKRGKKLTSNGFQKAKSQNAQAHFGDMSMEKRNQAEEEAMLDQLLEELNLVRKPIPKDGACLFSAVSDQIYLTQTKHREVRKICIDFLEKNSDLFKDFVGDMTWKSYLQQMKKPYTWGGQLELQALSLLFRVNFAIYSPESKKPTLVDNGFERCIMLCYYGNHYDCVYKKSQFEVEVEMQKLIYDFIDKLLGISPPQNREYKNIGWEHWKKRVQEQHTNDEVIAQFVKGLNSKETKNSPITLLDKEKQKKIEEALRNISLVENFPLLNPSQIDEKQLQEKNESNAWNQPKNWRNVFSTRKLREPIILAPYLKEKFEKIEKVHIVFGNFGLENHMKDSPPIVESAPPQSPPLQGDQQTPPPTEVSNKESDIKKANNLSTKDTKLSKTTIDPPPNPSLLGGEYIYPPFPNPNLYQINQTGQPMFMPIYYPYYFTEPYFPQMLPYAPYPEQFYPTVGQPPPPSPTEKRKPNQ